jgi:hypothetical protein
MKYKTEDIMFCMNNISLKLIKSTAVHIFLQSAMCKNDFSIRDKNVRMMRMRIFPSGPILFTVTNYTTIHIFHSGWCFLTCHSISLQYFFPWHDCHFSNPATLVLAQNVIMSVNQLLLFHNFDSTLGNLAAAHDFWPWNTYQCVSLATVI